VQDRPARLIAFVATTDLERAARFYVETMGLRLVEETPYACVFDVDGTMLRVTLVDDVARPGYTVLGLDVPDIAEAVVRLRERGVLLLRYPGMEQDDDGIWTTPNGDRVGWLADPDGNTLSLTQFA
jgi:catechol 2,3-dioxygenase-like lactoylglutathione lyase family enzyme